MTARAIDSAGLPRPQAPPTFPDADTWSARILRRLIALADAWAEAQELARAAHERYPFVDW